MFFHRLDVLAGEVFEVDMINFFVLAIELVELPQGVRRNLVVARVVREVGGFSLLLSVRLLAFFAGAQVKVGATVYH